MTTRKSSSQASKKHSKLRVGFRRICPESIRQRFIYPILAGGRAFTRKLFQSCEPFRLRIEAFHARSALRDGKRVSKALEKVPSDWIERIQDAVDCPDNAFLPRHPDAGMVNGANVTMHNGIRIRALSYYGSGILHLLVRNRGVHEPQEERAFREILPYIRPGGTMLELGAYWGFYSIWFSKEISDANCYLVEPDPRNIEAGRQNFRLNGVKGSFTCAAVGSVETTGLSQSRMVTVDDFCVERGIDRLNVLHADIQGAESLMLDGARNKLTAGLIDFIFISTHGDERHEECLRKLKDMGYEILCSADGRETYSLDGLIVAKYPRVEGPAHLNISHKSYRRVSEL